MGRGTLPEFWDELEDHRKGQGQAGDPQGGPGQVGGPTQRSGTSRLTLGEVRDGSRDPRRVQKWVG